MMISIHEDNVCWCCGNSDKKITSHHALPKYLNPVKNIIIPICESCHERLNAEDINGMYSYLYRVQSIIEKDSKVIKVALDKLNSLSKLNHQKEKRLFDICWLCGTMEDITPHHLSKSDLKPELMKRIKEGKLMAHHLDGEPCIPLCKECHDSVEYYKMMKCNSFKLKEKKE